MIVNNNMDFELSREETVELLNILMSPSEEIIQKRNAFFSKGDNIDIRQGKNGEQIAIVEGLDLSFLDEEKDKNIINKKKNIFSEALDTVESYENLLPDDMNYEDMLKILCGISFSEKINANKSIKSKIVIDKEKNEFFDFYFSSSSIAA